MELDDKHLDILRRALMFEEAHKDDQYFLGWTWYDVQAAPQMINKLVVEGLVKVNYSSHSGKNYLLADRDHVRALLEEREMEEEEEEIVVPDDLFDIIELHEDKKRILMMGLKAEKPVHFLLLGSVASAKSMFLSQLALLPRSVYVLGSSLSKAGLIEVLFERRPKFLIIDELDKVDDQDNTTALLSLMEGGRVVETKYNKRREGEFDTRVIASANHREKIAPELLSRFYTLWFREYTPDEYRHVATAVLTKREGLPPETASYIVERLLRDVGTRDVRDAVKVARLARTMEEVNTAIEIMIKQRLAGDVQEST